MCSHRRSEKLLCGRKLHRRHLHSVQSNCSEDRVNCLRLVNSVAFVWSRVIRTLDIEASLEKAQGIATGEESLENSDDVAMNVNPREGMPI